MHVPKIILYIFFSLVIIAGQDNSAQRQVGPGQLGPVVLISEDNSAQIA